MSQTTLRLEQERRAPGGDGRLTNGLSHVALCFGWYCSPAVNPSPGAMEISSTVYLFLVKLHIHRVYLSASTQRRESCNICRPFRDTRTIELPRLAPPR